MLVSPNSQSDRGSEGPVPEVSRFHLHVSKVYQVESNTYRAWNEVPKVTWATVSNPIQPSHHTISTGFPAGSSFNLLMNSEV